MTTKDIAPRETPEERELRSKKAQLEILQANLAQCELDMATLRAQLRAFELTYLRAVGARFAEIDELEAQIAEVIERQHPRDEAVRQRAVDARTKAGESARTIVDAELLAPVSNFTPSDDLKRLYREIAKRVHPDLAIDDVERAKRTQVMAEVNQAYESGDEARLRAILEAWETSPDAVSGIGIGAELVRIIRKIHQVERRLLDIEREMNELRGCELFRLKVRADAERVAGGDLLEQMATRLDLEIGQLRERRHALHSEGPSA